MKRRRAIVVLGVIGAGLLLAGASQVMAAEPAAGENAQAAHSGVRLFDDQGAAWFGAAIGAGLVIMGGAAGISRIGGSAVESMARQPEVAGSVNTAMIITAAMIEGATLFAVVVCLLATFK